MHEATHSFDLESNRREVNSEELREPLVHSIVHERSPTFFNSACNAFKRLTWYSYRSYTSGTFGAWLLQSLGNQYFNPDAAALAAVTGAAPVFALYSFTCFCVEQIYQTEWTTRASPRQSREIARLLLLAMVTAQSAEIGARLLGEPEEAQILAKEASFVGSLLFSGIIENILPYIEEQLEDFVSRASVRMM